MSDELDALIADMLEWIAETPRSHADVMTAWGTHCPRLPVWETACDRHYVKRDHPQGQGTVVRVTADGRAFLKRARRKAA